MPRPAPPPIAQRTVLDEILHRQASAAILLLAAAGCAFIAANTGVRVLGSSVAEWYHALWHAELGASLAGIELTQSLHHWINDGLMAIFFFLVGLEIKRELLLGELAALRKAMLPVAAAAGGMIVPALVYAAFNAGHDGIDGWGIPMATDIAFSAGLLGLLGKRVPGSLVIFLLALAIVDDLGSVIVIAVFYTDALALRPLLMGLAAAAAGGLMARAGVRSPLVYTLLFGLVWFEFLESGVHATIAGVLFAFVIPADARYETPLFTMRMRELLRRFEDAEDHRHPYQVNAPQQELLRAVEAECRHVEAPLQGIEARLHPLSAFVIMPLFAFANSGVAIDFGELPQRIFDPVTLGIVLGLVAGKPLGICAAAWIAVRLGMASLPAGVGWRQLHAVSWLGGIGFTVGLFVANLAFGDAHGGHAGGHLDAAKTGILIASALAACIGLYLVHRASPASAMPQSGAH